MQMNVVSDVHFFGVGRTRVNIMLFWSSKLWHEYSEPVYKLFSLKICTLLQQNNKLFLLFHSRTSNTACKANSRNTKFLLQFIKCIDSSAEAREATGIVTISGHHCMSTNIFVILI